MAEHLSTLALDELAAGLPHTHDARAHVMACTECAKRLDQLVAARGELARSHRYERTFEALLSAASAPQSARVSARPRWSLRKLVFAPALAAAMGLVLFVWGRSSDTGTGDTRLKGGASVRVLRSPDGLAISSAHPGERVVLSVTPADLAFGIIMAVDRSGEVNQVWPIGSARSGRLPAGAAVRLDPGFEVTPGSLVLHAFFSADPLRADDVRAHLEREVRERIRAGKSPLETSTEAVSNVVRATAVLTVEANE